MSANPENRTIADLLRQFSRGEGRVIPDDDSRLYARIEINGWLFTFFIDASELDYVESVERPDGSVAGYGELAEDDASDAVDLLTNVERAAIEQRLELSG